MFDTHADLLFLATAVVLVLSPGPDTMLVLSRTIASGPAAGWMVLLGTQIGNMVHALLAGLGVSTIILLVPVAYDLLRFAGVAYLLSLAAAAWRAPATLALDPRPVGVRGHRGRSLLQGLGNNLANPKMIAFFLALFPQFTCTPGDRSPCRASRWAARSRRWRSAGSGSWCWWSGGSGLWSLRRLGSFALPIASPRSPSSASPAGSPSSDGPRSEDPGGRG